MLERIAQQLGWQLVQRRPVRSAWLGYTELRLPSLPCCCRHAVMDLGLSAEVRVRHPPQGRTRISLPVSRRSQQCLLQRWGLCSIHALYHLPLPPHQEEIAAAYQAAKASGGYNPDCYMISNSSEYWAEGSQAWFEATVREGESKCASSPP